MKIPTRMKIGALMLAAIGAAAMQTPRAAAQEGMAQGAADPHAHHRAMMNHMAMDHAMTDHAQMHHAGMDSSANVKRSIVDYKLSDIRLVRDDGKSVSLPAELNDGRPVFMTFIYTTCTTICPVASQTFAQLQEALGSERSKVHLVSISIDPEQDTPARLREYAKRFGAGPNWQHYTGSVEASIAAQRAFDVYRGDKMNHNPVTLMRATPGHPWLRVDGFATAKELLRDYRSLTAG